MLVRQKTKNKFKQIIFKSTENYIEYYLQNMKKC